MNVSESPLEEVSKLFWILAPDFITTRWRFPRPSALPAERVSKLLERMRVDEAQLILANLLLVVTSLLIGIHLKVNGSSLGQNNLQASKARKSLPGDKAGFSRAKSPAMVRLSRPPVQSRSEQCRGRSTAVAPSGPSRNLYDRNCGTQATTLR
jgi:hypothetical protein